MILRKREVLLLSSLIKQILLHKHDNFLVYQGYSRALEKEKILMIECINFTCKLAVLT